LILLFHQKNPVLQFWIPGKRIVKWTVRVFKGKLNSIASTLAVPERFGESTAEDIYPMRNVTLAVLSYPIKTIAS